MGEEEVVDHTGPLSWRDVYKAVGETEQRIIAAIREATGPIKVDVADHETRLRKIESGDLPWVNRLADDASRTHSDQGKRVGDLETEIGVVKGDILGFKNRERWIITTLSGTQKVILGVAAVIGAIGAVAATLNFLTNLVVP